MRVAAFLLPLLLLVTPACRGPFPDRLSRPPGDAGVEAAASVRLEPEADPAAAPPVLRVEVELPEGSQASVAGLELYRGKLDAYYLRRILKQDLPKTLLERQVPSLAWAEDDAARLVLAPTMALDAGGTYSVASPMLGLIATLGVRDAGAAPLLARMWPPPDAGSGAQHPIYCADAGAPRAGEPIELAPGHVRARLEPGVGSSGVARGVCVYIASSELPDSGRFVPPPRVGDVALDPAPLAGGDAPALALPDCAPDETRLGPGCAEVEDDRVVIRSPDAPLFWAVVSPKALALETARAGGRFVVRGLSPSTTQTLDVTTVDLGGRERHSSVRLTTSSPRPHVVLNEVMANPLGPEPSEEWVELFNDGSRAVELDGWVLSDSAGATVLPSYLLEPQAYALVVREDYVLDDGQDVVPPSAVALLRVSSLGSRGLSNSGEPLKLEDPSGRVVSRFPAAPKPKPGISVARRQPWSLDDEPRSFALSGGKGASPGAANQLLE